VGEDVRVPLFELIVGMSSVMDLVCPAVVNHHKQVAYISCTIAEKMGLPRELRDELVLAATLHDVGAFYLKDRLELLHFELDYPHEHAESGYLLLKQMEPLQKAAEIVRYHHVPWKNGEGIAFKGGAVPESSHIVHLADRVAVSINPQQCVLGQIPEICDRFRHFSGDLFKPDLVDVFLETASRESFWLDIVSPLLSTIMTRKIGIGTVPLHDLSGLSRVFARIIDFRSHFTATHSSGVAATSESISKLAGFSDAECRAMRIAGYLHDIGKLAIAAEILEKPARLADDEVKIMRSHTYHTYRALEPIEELHQITEWASYHHEHLDGTGYPFHLQSDDLSTGARIMAVADVFTAVTEDRPYRKSMSDHNALAVLVGMANDNKLDRDIVSIVTDYFGEINSIRETAERKAVGEHRHFLDQLASANG